MIYFILGGIIILICGILIGVEIAKLYYSNSAFGTLRWAQSEDGPYLFLDMDRRPEEIPRHDFVIFKTDLKDGPHE